MQGSILRASGKWIVPQLFLLHLVLAFMVLGANPWRGESITPLDVLVSQRAWRSVDAHVQVRQPERTDIINGLLPAWIAARDQLRSGRLPLWNDRYAGGSSLLITNNSTYTPGFLVFAAVPDQPLGFHLAIVLNLAIGGLGMHLFLRRRVGWLAALCGAVTFQFCGFHAAWLYWPHVFTSIWIPWLLLAVDRCAERPHLRRALAIGLASALMILGGFPFVAELGFGAAALYFVLLWSAETKPAPWRAHFALWYVAGTLLGFLACAFPLQELAAFLQQYDLGYRQNRGSYLDLSHASRLLPPWSYEYKRVEQTMYVGLAMTTLACSMVIATLARWRRAPILAWFGLLLLVVAAGLVFELWPMSWVGWVPGMSFNSWSRGIVILDIALVVLGSLALDGLWKVRRSPSLRKAAIAFAAVVLVAQTAEIATFFHRYNGAVSSSYFYPGTKAIDYLQRHAGRFDYVVADDSFHISGALGAYGLREWFGHQFRTPALQAALADMVPAHFSSHTSSRFNRGQIRYSTPTMAVMNVRYLAVSSMDPAAEGPGARRPPRHRPLPPMPAHRWLQEFTLRKPTRLQAINVRLATYRRDDLSGPVRLALSDSAGGTIAISQKRAADIRDNAMTDFLFPAPVDLPAGTYGFTLEYAPDAGLANPRLTAWAADEAVAGTRLRVDGKETAGAVEYTLQVQADRLGPFRHVLTADGISVFENANSPRGPYFVGRLGDVPDAGSGRSVTVAAYSPARFVIRYSGPASGYVVVPMSSAAGWRVTVAGRPAQVERMRGIMPAVFVDGPATISFEFRPDAWKSLGGWLLLLSGALLWLMGLQRLLDRRNPPPATGAPA